jgi:hypothetical protein
VVTGPGVAQVLQCATAAAASWGGGQRREAEVDDGLLVDRSHMPEADPLSRWQRPAAETAPAGQMPLVRSSGRRR